VKKPSPKLTAQARRIVAAGRTAYGDQWQRRLAKLSGVSHQTLSFIAAGERPASDVVAQKVAVALATTAAELQKISREILANIEKTGR
jgi:transcriptional regulator with XRE-family HTH domain